MDVEKGLRRRVRNPGIWKAMAVNKTMAENTTVLGLSCSLTELVERLLYVERDRVPIL